MQLQSKSNQDCSTLMSRKPKNNNNNDLLVLEVEHKKNLRTTYNEIAPQVQAEEGDTDRSTASSTTLPSTLSLSNSIRSNPNLSRRLQG
jgi:hypothetical protein